ncbi:MAG: response regulator transcription factor [Anaerolineaceae bacterium]|nr:response regulator transcription factor [Anaerolineaceae bacterium]
MPKITVLIVDDHAVVRQGILTFLETNPDLEVIGSAEDGAAAIRLAKDLAPDVALVDLVLPGMDGVEITRALRRVSPHTQIVIFTSFHEDEQVFPAIRAGALSYLLKDARPNEIADAIRKAARGEAVLDSRVAARIVQGLQGADRVEANPFSVLSDRELEVLRLVATGASNQEIADKLVIGESTVKTHVGSILSKLHLADRTQAAVYAWAEGVVRK